MLLDPLALQHPKEHRFILAITYYFSKWVEVVPLKEVNTPNVIKFMKHHVLYRFTVPDESSTIMDSNSQPSIPKVL